jgi:hypothetical protein
MRGARLLAAALAVLAGGSWAKTGTPGPHYFEGVYERVGRSGGEAPMLLNDRVTITPVGQSVAIRACTGSETLMDFGPAFEIEYLMTGSSGTVGVECLFHNNGYNRPILTCRAQDGASYTLWPVAAGDPQTPLDCG